MSLPGQTVEPPPFTPPPNGGRPVIPPHVAQLKMVLEQMYAMLLQGGGGFNVACEVQTLDEQGRTRTESKTGIQAIVEMTDMGYQLIAVMEEFMDRLEEASEAVEPRPRRKRK